MSANVLKPVTKLVFIRGTVACFDSSRLGAPAMDWYNRSSRHALAASITYRLVLACTVLCTALAPSPAAAQASVNAVPSNLPLERYECIVPYRNGCNAIVRLGETAPDSATRWYGGCRFGLAHGPGIYRMDWTIDGVHSFAISQVDMYYGRSQGPSRSPAALIANGLGSHPG